MKTQQNTLLTNSAIGKDLISKDWTNSGLGNINNWPQNLIFALNLILQSKQPQCVCWGSQLFCFYNQAFKDTFFYPDHTPIHQGTPLESINTEVLNSLKHSFKKTHQTGVAEELEPLAFQNKTKNKSYFSFNFTPLSATEKAAEGVLVSCVDETSQIKANKKLSKLTSRFINIVKQAPIGVLIINTKTKTVDTVNRKYKEIFDENHIVSLGDALIDALPKTPFNLHNEILKTLETGKSFQLSEIPLTNTGHTKPRYFNFLGEVLKDENEAISGFILATTEVTDSVRAKQYVLKSENKFKNVILHSPIPIAVFQGENHVIKIANDTMLNDIWRKDFNDCFNKPLLDVFPELKQQKFPDLLDKVFRTGISHSEKEALATIDGNDGVKDFYFDYDYSPIFETDHSVSGLIITAVDVTEKVTTRKQIEKTETRLRIATEAAELATWELDLNNEHITYSKRLPAILGYPEDAVLSHEFIKNRTVKEDLDNILRPAFERALQTGSYFYEVRTQKKDDTIIWIRTQGKVFYNEDGTPIKVFGTLREITEEKRSQEQLIENEQKFKLLADSMPQKIWTANTKGELDYYNHTVYEYTGHTPETLNPSNWISIVHPDDKEENIKLWQQSIETGQDFLMEHRFLRHDGEYRWQLSRAIPQRDNEGNIQRWVGTSTDIQDHKMFLQELERQVKDRTKLLAEANAKLENSVEELQRMNEELQSFAYISSHDLQEPLRKIQIFRLVF
ncbi:PAS domain-containing protein [Formosa haliotis]|uniref:PAS domain-containing protein n=1 Tax=Formosa haliotis TaxID=1555194 RepID=UPI000824196D|nr:PAS domain-containing protein [Formosa haliotis]